MFPSRLVSVLGGGAGLPNNYSLEFDNTNDYINVGDLDLGTDDFTIGLWAKSTEWSSRYLMYKKEGSGGSGKYWYLGSTGADAMIFASSMEGTTTITYEGASSELTPYENQWVHLVLVADRDANTKGYINGVLQQTDTGSNFGDTLDNTGDLGIAWKGTAGGGVTGKLDEVAIWNKVLSAGDISALYQAKGTSDLNDDGNSANLQGWWRMGDGTLDDFNLIADQVNPTLGTDLIGDGGFESGTDSWNYVGTTISQSTDYVKSGTYSLKVVQSGGSSDRAYKTFTTVIGKTYKFSFDTYKPSSGQDVAYIMRVATGSDHGTPVSETISTLDAWVNTTGYVTATQTTFYIVAIPHDDSAGDDTVYIDNVSVKLVNGNPGLMTNMASDDIVKDTP
mgnify:CR=1 FL=1